MVEDLFKFIVTNEPEKVYQAASINTGGFKVTWKDVLGYEKSTFYSYNQIEENLAEGVWLKLHDNWSMTKCLLKTEEQEHTGGSVNYYKVEVKSPTTFDQPYRAECNDIIEALDMNYAEGNAFKAIWRRCAERQGKKKKGNNTFYDAEKIVFFAQRILEQEKGKQ